MAIPDTFTFIERNNSLGHYFHDSEMFTRLSMRRGPIQIDNDADIYYGYYDEKDKSNNEE
jgi:hypothetical protein